MNRFLDRYCRLLDAVSAIFLALMVVLVFGNVVLRYLFNSGITVSEELSRWLFVWVTFMGSIVALRHHGHLGTDMLTSRLRPGGRKFCLLAAHAVMIYVAALLLRGCWVQAEINMSVASPATGWPVAVVYAAGVLFGVSAIAILIAGILRILGGHAAGDELSLVKDSEESHGIRPSAPPVKDLASHAELGSTR